MSLASVVRGAVATANKVTNSLQATVSLKQWISQDAYGTPTYGPTIRRTALVEQGENRFKTPPGVLINTKATVTFLQPIPANGAAGRTEPIDDRDILTLADGTSGPAIVGEPMLVNPETDKPYFQIVGIGK